jgi:hypothetical protein
VEVAAFQLEGQLAFQVEISMEEKARGMERRSLQDNRCQWQVPEKGGNASRLGTEGKCCRMW